MFRTFRDENDERARQKERQFFELNSLKESYEGLSSQQKVSEHQVEQLKGALRQLNNELTNAKMEFSRSQRALGNNILFVHKAVKIYCFPCNRLWTHLEAKQKQLNELAAAESNSYAVFGDWVPPLLQRIERTGFRGMKPKGPLGMSFRSRH